MRETEKQIETAKVTLQHMEFIHQNASRYRCRVEIKTDNIEGRHVDEFLRECKIVVDECQDARLACLNLKNFLLNAERVIISAAQQLNNLQRELQNAEA